MLGIINDRDPRCPHAAGIAAYCIIGQESAGVCQNSCSVACSSYVDRSANPPGPAYGLHVVAIGTGTKCLGGSQRSAAGDLLNDSHAEAIARRAFVAWMYQQLRLAAKHWSQQHQQDKQQLPSSQQQAASDDLSKQGTSMSPSAFYWCVNSNKFKLHHGIRFAMYISQPPCGDASIYMHQCEQQATQSLAGAGSASQQQASHCNQLSLQQPGGPVMQHSRQGAAGKTGAKLIRLAGASDVGQAAAALDARQHEQQQAETVVQQHPNRPERQQQMGPCVPTASEVETGPQQLGAVRRKPGKGDPTLSLSCSDKIARWACLGLQGCLPSSCLAEPIYLDLLVVGTPGICTADTATTAAGMEQPLAATAAATTAEDASAVVDNEPADGLCVNDKQLLLAAVEAAGDRAFHSRLTGCCEVLKPPFVFRPPKVVAVPAADNALGLYPDNSRKVPSGVRLLLWFLVITALPDR